MHPNHSITREHCMHYEHWLLDRVTTKWPPIPIAQSNQKWFTMLSFSRTNYALWRGYYSIHAVPCTLYAKYYIHHQVSTQIKTALTCFHDKASWRWRDQSQWWPLCHFQWKYFCSSGLYVQCLWHEDNPCPVRRNAPIITHSEDESQETDNRIDSLEQSEMR